MLKERHVLPVLVAGFTLLVMLLLVSGVIAVDSMRSTQAIAADFAAEQQATLRLIGEIQSEEGNLSSVFYSLAAGPQNVDAAALLKRLDALESAIHRTTDVGTASRDSALWNDVRRAVDAFIEEGRATLRSRREPSSEFFLRHQNLLTALAELTGSNFSTVGAVSEERKLFASRIRYALLLMGAAVLVALGGALLTVYHVTRMFRRLQWQAEELAGLSSRTMNDHEAMATRLSREMHDHFGQTLSAIEANLVSMQNAKTYHTGRIEDCLGLVKDAVQNVREVSQLLRPSILDDFGLDASLRWLADGFAERTGRTVRYSSTFTGRLQPDSETQLFRIAQEALTNVARHANATTVDIDFCEASGGLRLTISDNGKGLNMATARRGCGLVGMRARARAVGAEISVRSRAGEGVTVSVVLPSAQSIYESQNTNPVSR
ncbi:MAG: sensor histidine kinase [Candidatus Solibacter sp.]